MIQDFALGLRVCILDLENHIGVCQNRLKAALFAPSARFLVIRTRFEHFFGLNYHCFRPFPSNVFQHTFSTCILGGQFDSWQVSYEPQQADVVVNQREHA